MDAIIKVNMGNAAFDEGNGYELARILRELADRLENGGHWDSMEASLRDYNGNKVGTIEIKEG